MAIRFTLGKDESNKLRFIAEQLDLNVDEVILKGLMIMGIYAQHYPKAKLLLRGESKEIEIKVTRK